MKKLLLGTLCAVALTGCVAYPDTYSTGYNGGYISNGYISNGTGYIQDYNVIDRPYYGGNYYPAPVIIDRGYNNRYDNRHDNRRNDRSNDRREDRRDWRRTDTPNRPTVRPDVRPTVRPTVKPDARPEVRPYQRDPARMPGERTVPRLDPSQRNTDQ